MRDGLSEQDKVNFYDLFSLIGSFIRTWKSSYIGTLTIEQETKALQG